MSRPKNVVLVHGGFVDGSGWQEVYQLLRRDAGDLPLPDAQFMADSQVPWGVKALSGAVSEPAWRHKCPPC